MKDDITPPIAIDFPRDDLKLAFSKKHTRRFSSENAS